MPESRFLDKVEIDENTGCWNWNGGLDEDGYGRFFINRKNVRAHRWSYTFFIGEIPPKIMVCHTCDNPRCVNPEHLFLGNARVNNNDMLRKQRCPQQKLTFEKADEIRSRYEAGGVTQQVLADEYGVSFGTISAVVNYRSYVQ
jgi:hypothetical protein